MAAKWVIVALSLAFAACVAEKANHYDCIVVGMGVAGATAAATLAHAGKHVLALEASERIGGHVHTVDFAGGVVELGEEWVQGQKSNRIYNMAIEHNLTLLSQPMDTEVLCSDGSVADAVISDIIMKGMEMVEADHGDKPQPLGEVITNKLMDYIKEKHPEIMNNKDTIARILDFMDLYVDGTDASNSWMDVNAGAPYETLEGDQFLSFHKLGFKTFIELMLNTHKGGPGLPSLEIKLNSPVTLVQWPQKAEEPVLVTCSDGKQFSADTAIITVPLGVLKEKHTTMFSPPLPNDKVTAIEKLDMGVIDKIILSFDKKWWGSKSHPLFWKAEDIKKVPAADQWTTKIMWISPPMGCDNALTLFISGETAKMVETLPKEEIKTKTMAILRRFFGAKINIPEPKDIIRSKWFANEFMRGSFSFTGMKAAAVPGARHSLAAPLVDGSGRARVMLAGEAAHETRYATAHGAADSGFNAANILLGKEKAA